MTNLTLTAASPWSPPPATFTHDALRDKIHGVLAWPDWPSVLFQPQKPWTFTLPKLLNSSVQTKAWNPEMRGGREKPPLPQRTADEG